MPRRATLALALGFAALSGPSLWAPATMAAPALGADDRKLLTFWAEADGLAAQGKAQNWPGYRFDKYPLVVFSPDRVAFQFNGHKPLPGFAPLGNPPARGRFPVFVRYGSTRHLMPNFAISDYVQTIGGQKVIPIALSGIRDALPTGYSPASLHYFPLLVHLKETYSWYPEYMARGEEWIAKYPLFDDHNFAMADLEAACLKRAVTAYSLEDSQTAARWFVAVRQARHDKLSDTSRRHESYQEALVGAARYGALHLATAGSAADFRTQPAFRSLGKPHPSQADLIKWLADAFDVPMDSRALTRERLTLTGIAEGFLLDRFGAKDWRRGLPAAGSLAALLARAVAYSDGERTNLIADAKKAFNYEVMLMRAQGLASNTRNMAEAFDRQEGWTVKVRLPQIRDFPKGGKAAGLRWTPPDIRALEIDSQTLLLISLKELFFTSPTVDIRLAALPTKFYSTEYANPFRHLIIRTPLEKGSVVLDGRALDMVPGRYAIGREFRVLAPKVSLKITHGAVKITRDSIEVEP